MERIALCGGTFDPFHLGHLNAPLSVRDQFAWDRIIYIPAWRQPFKLDQQVSSGYHRFAMAVLATRDDDRLDVSPFELEREAVSYTIDTAIEFRRENRDAVIDWIIGDDNLALLPEWRRIDELFSLMNFAVLQRAGTPVVPESMRSRVVPPDQRGKSGSICFGLNARIEISSTEVRRRLHDGEPVNELVHPAVVHYINKNRLYSTTGVMN